MADEGKKSEPETNVQLQLSVTAGPPPAAAPAVDKPAKAPWLTPVTAPILVATLALIAPVTTAVNAHFQADLQLELDRQKQADERTKLYLERAISADAGAESRVQVLRFLQIQATDPELQRWAVAELEGLSPEVDELKQKEETLVTEVAQTQQVVSNLSLEHDELAAKLEVEPPAEQTKLKAQLSAVRKNLERERVNQAEKEAKLSRVSGRLRGGERTVQPPNEVVYAPVTAQPTETRTMTIPMRAGR